MESIPNDPPLSCNYTYWFSYDKAKPYDERLLEISTFDTIGKIYTSFNLICPPDNLKVHADYLIFKTGIKPLWEDSANINGGKWILRLKKGLANLAWQRLVLAMLDNQFDNNDDICGVVVSVRGQEDIFSVWTKTRDDDSDRNGIRETLYRVLELPRNTVIEYKEHCRSIKDSSSFYNTVIPPIGGDK